ncbi:hypothetical protein B296_00012119 [Ensete ventricosum]|uniref:Uncharacterized protein n=1 Tax=Ensete ventricosum TaxID=4639 RepID=A0A427B813_ENSVE|nr:hypothetical protein B296_00012119 [Ensete ventricosum]
MLNMNLMHDLPKVGGGRAGATTSSATASSPVIAPAPAQSVAAPSPPKVQEIPPKEATQKTPESSGKCAAEAPSSQQKKARVSGRHKSRREGEKLKSRATDGKRPRSPDPNGPSSKDHGAGEFHLSLLFSFMFAYVDLPRQAIEDYKKSPGFEMGLVRMGQVSLEYGYQLVLARFRAQYPDLEIEEDPFKELPKDSNVSMTAE